MSGSAQAPVAWLRSGREGLALMLDAIRGARHSVGLEIYILQESEVGERFRSALQAAAARGVRVRVLVDAIGSLELPADYLRLVNEAGGDCRWFNPLELGRLSYRDHRKLLVVDDEVAFVPGFNIASEYDGDGVTCGWRDVGLVIHGPLVGELARSFHAMFGAASFRHRRLSRFRRQMRPQRVETAGGELFLLSPGRGRNPARQALMDDVARSRRIRLTTAYFLPPVPLRRALIAAARRGASVELLLSGVSDVRLAQAAARGQYARLLKAGVRLFEYQPTVLHAKRYLLDDVVYAGSANLDLRSFNINYEILVRLVDSRLAEEGHASFDDDLSRSKEITWCEWRGRSWWHRWLERLASVVLVRLDLRFAMRQLHRLRGEAGRRAFRQRRREARTDLTRAQ